MTKELCIKLGAVSGKLPTGGRRRRWAGLVLFDLVLLVVGIGLLIVVADDVTIDEDTSLAIAGNVMAAAGTALAVFLYLAACVSVTRLAVRFLPLEEEVVVAVVRRVVPMGAPNVLSILAVWRARRLLRQIEYSEVVTQGSEVGVSVAGVQAALSAGRELTRAPLSELDVVREFERLVVSLPFPVVIAIDELDKMTDDDEAIAFLNRLKILFTIRNCSFVVSVSQNAWARFESRGLPFRDAFDSVFDDVVRVPSMRFAETRAILIRRFPLVTDLQALLCHCLSGGLPRDALRLARRIADASEPGVSTLSEAMGVVLDEEVELKATAARLRAQAASGERNADDTLQHLTSLQEAWDANTATDSPVLYLIDEHPNAPERESRLESEIVREFTCYLAFLHTVREAFAPDGPARRLTQTPALNAAFESLATARADMTIDLDAAYRSLLATRQALELTADHRRVRETNTSETAFG